MRVISAATDFPYIGGSSTRAMRTRCARRGTVGGNKTIYEDLCRAK